MKRRSFMQTTGGAALSPLAQRLGVLSEPPNIVLIVADDLGYGDLGCYGSHIHTPNLDNMAREGVLFRQFYSASPVCSPSRASILTGRYGVRGGVPSVLQAADSGGLALTETTMAQMLKAAGYRTMCVGKWHLGRPDPFLPTNRGFDEYYGIPYSNDMEPSILMHNTSVIESPVDLTTLTRRYTEQAVNFIRQSKGSPFFLYFPHTFPHIPLAVSPAFAGKSLMGEYGDVVEELDWSAGQVLQSLKDTGVDTNTLVIFTSDNGPWFQGSPGRLRGRKGETFEGGMREPFIARFPGKIPGGRVSESFATALDLMPTVANLARAALPASPMDGVDIGPLLAGPTLESIRRRQLDSFEHPLFLYFSNWDLQCARVGLWKLHMARRNTPAYTPEPKVGSHNLRLLNPELYDMDADSDEAEDVSSRHPELVADIQNRVKQILPGLPTQVQSAWHDTQNRPVNPNQPGAWPTIP